MPTSSPETAAAAIVEFLGDLFAAILLRGSVYRDAVADPRAWRRAAVIVILAGMASDSLGLYSHLDRFLVVTLANWSLLAIMLLAIARWYFGTGVAWIAARAGGMDMDYAALMRAAGYAYAPGALHILPAVLYWVGVVPVTLAIVTAIHWLVLPWILVALTVAVRAAGVTSLPRAFTIGLVIFVASNLFDVLLDGVLFVGLGLDGVGTELARWLPHVGTA